MAGIHTHPDYSRAVLEDLYDYPRKRKLIAWQLWVFTGLLGGHRFYLNRTGTGILMLVTGGGGMVWWIIDAFLLSGMVDRYNGEQETRERASLPPIALDFMPALREVAFFDRRPAWAERREGTVRLVGDGLVLLLAGSALGTLTADQGEFEALAAVLVLIAVTNMGARWERLARLPVLRELDRWSHRLRIFYHTNDPGGPLSLLFRPLLGPVTAFFSKRARAEINLYLQLGAVFVIGFTLLDLVDAGVVSRSGLDFPLGELLQDIILTFVMVYAFATPIGATLTTHLLLERTDWVVWTLSAISLGAIAMGMFVA
ncbi:MAG: TM2 domain-containing protein [Gemmatimonadetes bacterium]|uniref:TM2 domain-containing protein n=1 Tax=Candidatus Kutchimonas denitrificans TaxID=3056748 RepID=A0AAE4Z8U8_9BACT|nr:TM2 domain-containing protein [Gemmatimonadota bacterium]NIR75950.1 TM2 domain-containing protein [Candidatus Kutchimonas denitrificans]NIS02108.1 TM2 domain-containing protein [Gemmatimonadota bacterium]NIT67933.1 TM2 domain-containing protein [Gemmatimonadota bacterium]NIU53927.1 NINE protein [Gemmatimonadota bacterium]